METNATEEEGELSDQDRDSVIADQDQMLSEEQSYQETEAFGFTWAGVIHQISTQPMTTPLLFNRKSLLARLL